LQTQIIAINHFKKGDSIGYGGTWACPQDMPVGVAAIGYGDGYPRHAGSGTPVIVNGQRTQLVGRVSMDMISIDLRTVTSPQVGDPVTLWGEGLPIEEIARCASTISYELLCGITQRVEFVEVSDAD
jgi:alanine racemase